MPRKPIKTVGLYHGQIKIDFYEGHINGNKYHYYKIDDKKVIGVTNVLGIIDKPALKFWAVNKACNYLMDCIDHGVAVDKFHIDEARKQHLKASQEAADIGKQVHMWCEAWINDRLHMTGAPDDPEDERVRNGVLAFMRWVNEHKVSFISSERLIYSVQHQYAGLMDAEAVIDGKRAVIDFKTSRASENGGIYNEYRYQTAAYQKAAEEEGSSYDTDRYILRFDKDTGDFESYQCNNLDKDFNTFLGALAVKRRELEIAAELKENSYE